MLSASFGCTLPILCQLMHLDFFYNFSYYITYIILQHCSLSSHFSFVSCCLARTHHDIHILLISYLAYIFFNKRSCPVQVPTSKWVPAVGALYKTSVYYYLLPTYSVLISFFSSYQFFSVLISFFSSYQFF